jgi:hypothetical protein
MNYFIIHINCKVEKLNKYFLDVTSDYKNAKQVFDEKGFFCFFICFRIALNIRHYHLFII